METNNSFELEHSNCLDNLYKKYSNIEEFKYFLNLGKIENIFLKKENKPRVILLSHSFPIEIIHSLNLSSCYVLGGSYEYFKNPDINLPVDCSELTKSILGILKSDYFNLNKSDVLLLPYSSDDYRIMEKVLKDQLTIIGYDIPNDYSNVLCKKRYIDEIKRVTKLLSTHFKKHFSLRALNKEIEIYKKASISWQNFENLYINNNIDIDLTGFVYLFNSYYFANDILQWSNNINKLTNKLKEKATKTNDKKLLLIGSPIYFPNYKILNECDAFSLNVKYVIHEDVTAIKRYLSIDKNRMTIKSLAAFYYDSFNDKELVSNVINSKEVKGIIYHKLKGDIRNINYEMINKLLVNKNIPILRMETTYSYQDIEKLRFKFEAFKEILN